MGLLNSLGKEFGKAFHLPVEKICLALEKACFCFGGGLSFGKGFWLPTSVQASLCIVPNTGTCLGDI